MPASGGDEAQGERCPSQEVAEQESGPKLARVPAVSHEPLPLLSKVRGSGYLVLAPPPVALLPWLCSQAPCVLRASLGGDRAQKGQEGHPCGGSWAKAACC